MNTLPKLTSKNSMAIDNIMLIKVHNHEPYTQSTEHVGLRFNSCKNKEVELTQNS